MNQPIALSPVLHFLRRPTWAVTAITVISCAALAAHATSSIVASRIALPSTTAPSTPARPAPEPPPPRHHRSATGQLASRGMFCSSCTVVIDPAGNRDFVLAPAVLIATSLGKESRATVRVLTSEIQGSWGVGETIPGLGRVDRIASQWIEIIEPLGHHGWLRLVPPAASPGSDPARSESPAAANPWGDRIQKLDDQTYAVDRALVRELVSGSAGRATGRLIPATHDGVASGVKVYAVKPETIPFAIGLQNGDEIQAVNGVSLTSAQALLDLYAGLDQLSSAELSIVRHGQPITRTLRLR